MVIPSFRVSNALAGFVLPNHMLDITQKSTPQWIKAASVQIEPHEGQNPADPV
jgi:hypothetical protein